MNFRSDYALIVQNIYLLHGGWLDHVILSLKFYLYDVKSILTD